MHFKNINYLAGTKKILIKNLAPYSNITCEFFNELSVLLLKSTNAKKYTDIISFAFWCRKKNIQNFKNDIRNTEFRVGLGLIFHICPSNIPVNFAYSFAFGLLSGNSNIVRVPSKSFPQVKIICDKINFLFKTKKFKSLNKMNLFVRYDQQDIITSFYSSICNARIIWGGDKSVNNIKKIMTPPKSIDITFPDRYSFCLINSNLVCKLDIVKLRSLVNKFYNDTYIVDQNGCSSPHLIVWVGSNNKKAKQIFWETLFTYVEKNYYLENINAIDKYTKSIEDILNLKNIKSIQRHGNQIYRVALKNLNSNNHLNRGKNGFFYEYESKDINELAKIINNKYQTLTYFGVKKSELIKFIKKNNLLGLDRIVPIGQSLDMGIHWDGFDMPRTLSRIIEIK